MPLCFFGGGGCTVVLEAPDHVLRSQGKMIDPQTGGELNVTAVTDPQNVRFVFGYQLKNFRGFYPPAPRFMIVQSSQITPDKGGEGATTMCDESG